MTAIKKLFPVLLLLATPFTGAPAGAAGTGQFRFAVMGCAHLGVCGPDGFELAVRRIKEQKPDFVLFLGGMIDLQAGQPAETLWREFDRVTSELGVPVYNVYGECGLSPLSVEGKKTALSEKLYIERYGKPDRAFVYKNNLFILLASDGLNSPPRAGQLKFLESSLSGASGYDNVFLAQHDSPWSQKEESDWMKAVRPLIQGKVKYIFGAGAHFLDVREEDGATYVTSGIPSCMSGETRRPDASHFLLADVRNSRVELSVVQLTPTPLEGVKVNGRRSGPKYKLVKQLTLDSEDRKAILPAETVLNALKIKPGMKIADIGSGTGFFAFPMADTLNGTGMVFAVDVDPAMTEYVSKRAEKEGYKNILAATIGRGLDPFYTRHTFDIILMSEVYHHYVWNPDEYLRLLRRSLSGDGGRLYVIHFKTVPDFSEAELGDLSGALKSLRSKKIFAPVLKKAGEGVEEFVENWKGEPIPRAIRERLLSNLNKLLVDRQLLGGIMKLQSTENPDVWDRLYMAMFEHDRELLRWLIVDLDEKGVFDEDKRELSEAEAFELKTLNWTLLTGILRSEKLYFLKGARVLYVGKRHIVKALERSGFTFVQEHAGLPYYHFLEFKSGGD